jgi:hypothetical protein
MCTTKLSITQLWNQSSWWDLTIFDIIFKIWVLKMTLQNFSLLLHRVHCPLLKLYARAHKETSLWLNFLRYPCLCMKKSNQVLNETLEMYEQFNQIKCVDILQCMATCSVGTLK